MLERTTADESQTQLLRRIAAQDRQALSEFYDQTAGLLFSTAVRVLGDASEAEEVTQDVFLQIWTKAATFDETLGVPTHWALSITRNRCIDRLRTRQRRHRVLEAMAQETDTFPPLGITATERALNEEDTTMIRAAVQGLPSDQQQAIEMAFFGGMTHGEIAAALNEPLGTIKARIRRGMLKLRENLQAYA
jgi:RNA polymerase sigma-70 factor, ECF subfamily